MFLCSSTVEVTLPEHAAHTTLSGLEFHLPRDTSLEPLAKNVPHDARITFLAVVETARVPVYLACGPALEVYTSDEATEEWMFEILTGSDLEMPHLGVADQGVYESSNGLLLQVECLNKSAHGPPIEQLLVYAASSPPPSASPQPTSGLITPPRSSSPALPAASNAAPECPIKVYAIPLTSEAAFHNALSAISPPTSPLCPASNQFLDLFPSSTTETENEYQSAPAAKRPRLDSVLSAARGARSKASGRGASKLMAGLDRSCSASASQPFGLLPSDMASEPKMLQPRKRPKPASSTAAQPGLSRSHTTGHISASGTLLHRRTGSLHRVASLAGLPASHSRAFSRPPSSGSGARPDSGRNSPAMRASPALTDGSRPGTREGKDAAACGVGSDAQNKNVLSRCVMAGMRLWGYTQVKSKKAEKKEGGEEREVELGDEEEDARRRNEEYKTLYHQTFKAAGFALRRRAEGEALAPDRVREVVERLLELFCSDEADALRPRTPIVAEMGGM